MSECERETERAKKANTCEKRKKEGRAEKEMEMTRERNWTEEIDEKIENRKVQLCNCRNLKRISLFWNE